MRLQSPWHWVSLNEAGFLGLENGPGGAHIRRMEKTIALSIIAAFVVFVAVYGMMAWKRPGK
jgi:hypothetical protein